MAFCMYIFFFDFVFPPLFSINQIKGHYKKSYIKKDNIYVLKIILFYFILFFKQI